MVIESQCLLSGVTVIWRLGKRNERRNYYQIGSLLF